MSNMFGLIGNWFGGNDTHTTTTSQQLSPREQRVIDSLLDTVWHGQEEYYADPSLRIPERNTHQDRALDLANYSVDYMHPRAYGDSAGRYLDTATPPPSYSANAFNHMGSLVDVQGPNRSRELDQFTGVLDHAVGPNRMANYEQYAHSLEDDIGANYADPAFATYDNGGYAIQASGEVPLIGGSEIFDFANPYMDEMIDVRTRRLEDDHARTEANIAGEAARRSAFGGSGEAVANFLADQQKAEALDDIAVETAYDSYGQGIGVAQANQGARSGALDRFINTTFTDAQNRRSAAADADALQTSNFGRHERSANMGINVNNAAEGAHDAFFNRLSGAKQFDVGTKMQSDQLADAAFGRALQSGNFDLNALNQGAQLDQNYFDNALASINTNLGVLGTQDQLNSSYLSRLNSAGSNLYGQGNDIWNYQQSVQDRPWTEFSRMAPFVPSFQPTQTSTQPVYNNGWQTALGAAATFSGLF